MIENELIVKGIILSVYAQGEYGKRISLLSDKFGKITVFAQGAAKQSSKIIGAIRPFVCGEFTIASGRGSWNLHGVRVMESFEEIPLNPESAFLGTYILEVAGYFAEEGITEEDAKKLLNLMYVTLMELKKPELPAELIQRIYELKMLVQEGLYTELPCEDTEICRRLWDFVLTAPLTKLFDHRVWSETIDSEKVLNEAGESFAYSVKHLRNSQIEHRFKSEELL